MTQIESLKQLEATLTEQNASIEAVRGALQEMDARTVLQVSKAWTEAFDAATEVVHKPVRTPFGALRV